MSIAKSMRLEPSIGSISNTMPGVIQSETITSTSLVGDSMIHSMSSTQFSSSSGKGLKRKFESNSTMPTTIYSESQPIESSSIFSSGIKTRSLSQLHGYGKVGAKPDLTIPWRKKALTVEEAHQEMVANTKKAIEEHKVKEGAVKRSVYAPYQSLDNQNTNSSIALTCEVAEKQGKRPSMEDAHFFEKIPEGYVAGIFDGHGGIGVAKAASEMFPKVFSKTLKATDGHVHRALEATINQVHKKVVQSKVLRYVGSTAAISFIKENGEMYTATVGDSEVFRYRKNGSNHLESTALSCVRDWSDPAEVKRASKIANTVKEKDKIKSWDTLPNAKMRRVQNAKGYTLNLSRSIGDSTYAAVSLKPEITIDHLQEGDRVGFFCDGVTDFVYQKEVVGLIQNHGSGNLSEKVANFAIDNKKSTDNVTAMFLHVGKK